MYLFCKNGDPTLTGKVAKSLSKIYSYFIFYVAVFCHSFAMISDGLRRITLQM